MSLNLHQRITDAILEQIETADPASWTCPWHRTGGGLPTNALTKRTYRGVNILSLWCGARGAGYADERWATYKQWSELGARVRRGEKGTLVIFYKDLPGRRNGEGRHDDGDRHDGENDGPRFIARASTVFNAAQVNNWQGDREQPASSIAPTPNFDSFVSSTRAVVRIGGHRPGYVPTADEIRMPPRSTFFSAEGYIATLAHELIHWTGAKHRLNRDLSSRFGTRAYAAEELVAELGSAFVVAGLGLAVEPHPQHAAYVLGWLPLLRADPRAIFTAAAQASRSADYLQSDAFAPSVAQ